MTVLAFYDLSLSFLGSHSGSSFWTVALIAFAENLDLDLGAGLGEIGAQHAERDRFVHPVAKAS